ncbi:MAG: class I SAM-dependent methyltransferase [Bacteroidetes bacterium]|nr:class I SAM-dependent methyltransferase [Bacteroidota bacterium]
MEKTSQEWFTHWFDSRWYPSLYAHRNEAEAQAFIELLMRRLMLPPQSHLLDLGCGQGRHSRALHALGYRVTGVDLSPNNIATASAMSAPGLQYVRADMRALHLQDRFDAVLNLFTSFGYFADIADNTRVLRNIYDHLKPGGWFVLDFFNAAWVRRHLVPEEVVERPGVRFLIRRYLVHEKVRKEITVTHRTGTEFFYEEVQLFTPATLRTLLIRQGFTLAELWGDYEGNPFWLEKSPRCIFIARAPGA